MKRQTLYAIVVEPRDDNKYLEDQYLLGWDNESDWFDANIFGHNIIDNDGNIMDNQHGLIEIDYYTFAYASDNIDDLKKCCESANEEGIDCVVCKIEKDNDGQYIIVPVVTED